MVDLAVTFICWAFFLVIILPLGFMLLLGIGAMFMETAMELFNPRHRRLLIALFVIWAILFFIGINIK